MKYRVFIAVVISAIFCQASTFHFSDPSDFDSQKNPVDWTTDNPTRLKTRPYLRATQPAQLGDQWAMCIVYPSSYSDTVTTIWMTNAIPDEAICDNFVYSIELYVEPKGAATTVNRIQPVISIDDNEFVSIGDPIALKSESISKPSWMTNTVSVTIQDANKKNIKIGLKMISGRNDSSGYVKSISVGFKVGAMIKGVDLVSADQVWNSTSLVPNISDLRVRAKIDLTPKDDVKVVDKGVVAEIVAHTNRFSMGLEPSDDGYWYSDKLPLMDAGVVGTVLVKASYSSQARHETIDPTNEYGVATSTSPLMNLNVGKLGSIWINEITEDAVEFCGTTNRIYKSGWKLSVGNNSANSKFTTIDIPFDDFGVEFKETIQKTGGVVGFAHTNDFGFATYEYPLTLRLINPSDIVEDEVVLEKCPDVAWGRVGHACWNEEFKNGYDWTGTAAGTVFSWTNLVSPSIGDLNCGQGFKTPVDKRIKITALIDAGGSESTTEILPYANVSVTVDDFLNTAAPVDYEKNLLADATGSVLFELQGWTVYLSSFSARIAAAAFGWNSAEKTVDIPRTIETSEYLVQMKPSTAFDDFQSELLKTWGNEGSLYNNKGQKKTWLIRNDPNFGKYLQLDTASTTHGYQELINSSPLYSAGKSWVNLSCVTKNVGADDPATHALYVIFGTNETFTGDTVVSSVICGKNSEGKNWYQWANQFKLDKFVGEPRVYVKLRGEVYDYTSTDLSVKDFRIAFQDMVNVTKLRRSGTEKNPGFEIDVEPLCAEGQCVSNVSVQLMMDVRGKVFANDAVVGNAVTNNLSEKTTFTVSPEVVSAGLQKALGYSQLRDHDTVKFWAVVKYYADSRDPDPEKEWEQCIFPDNRIADGENRWVVEGEYTVDMKAVEDKYSYSVSGNPFGLNEDVVLDPANVSNAWFSVRAYDTAGVSNVTVTVSTDGHEDVYTFVTNVTDLICYDFDVLATGLVADVRYTVTVTGVNVNGGQISPEPYTFEFTTLPEMPQAEIAAISTSEVKLSVSGKAAGYVVDALGWVPSGANAWVKDGLSADSRFSETVKIYATNQVGKVSLTNDFQATCYTFAAPATKAPTIEKVVNEVKVWAPDGYVATQDDNQTDTEYTIRVVTSAGKTKDVNQWQTLADWKNPVVITEKYIDLEATNNFWFITRNHDGIVTGNDNKDATTNCWFELVADITNVVQKADPFGTVDIALKFFDPARKEAKATVKYSFDGKSWTDVCDPFEVQFVDFTAGTNLSWNARAAVESSFAETDWNTNHVYSLQVQLTAGSRTSEWMVKDGCEVDFTKPEVTEFSSDVPDAFNKPPMKVTVKFSKPVVDFTAEKVEVGNGTKGVLGAGLDNTYTIDVTPVDQGLVTVQIKTVKDKFGNESEPTSVLTKTYDTGAPVWDEEPITGTPANGSATNGTWYALTAHAKDKDNLTAITYHWSFDEKTWTDGQEFTGNVTGEKGYTAYVYVTDAAGNVSTTNTWSWTYDKTAPVWDTPAITGTPANGSYTNKAHYALTAYATDVLTEVTYHWSFDKQTWTAGQTFEDDVVDEGGYTLYVYATDRAGNVAPTNEWSWTYDETAPSVPVIEGAPTDKSVTTEKSYRFTAKSEDNIKADLTYSWQLNKGAEVMKSEDKAENDPFAGSELEDGIYTVTVKATDKAGNTSVSTNWTWTVDTTPPDKPIIGGRPAQGVHTNVNDFAFTANSETKTKDLTTLTYHWLTNGVWAADITNFIGYVTMEGEHTVSVYATDKAGNTSETNSLSWVYDRTPPDKPNFTAECNPKDNDITNDPSYLFKASSSDMLSDFVCYWKKSWDATEASGFSIEGNLGNEANNHFWVEVWAKDVAGNVSATNRLSWTLDQIPPELDEIDPATPTNGAFTAKTTFNFKGNATDNLTTITYHWLTNGVWAADVTNLTDEVVGRVAAEGQHTYSVYATDEAKNISKTTNSVTWTVDWTAPTNLVVIGEPANGSITNMASFSLKAMVMDLTEPTICWTLDGGQMEKTSTNVVFERSGPLSQGLHTVECYAVDQAGNESVKTNWTWTVDTVAPVVKIAPDGVGDRTFAKTIPFKITVTDKNKIVTALDGNDFTVMATNENGVAVENLPTINGFTSINDGNTNYTFTVDSPAEASQGPIMISVTMKSDVKVVDAAGNSTSGVEGKVVSDRTQPEIAIWTDAVPTNKLDSIDYTMTVTSFSPITNNLTTGDFVVPQGCTVTACDGFGPTISGGIYTNYSVTVSTPTSGDTLMKVALKAGSVFNSAGNSNDVANANTVISDHTPPVPVVTCTASSLTNNLPAIPFAIFVAETNGLDGVLNTLGAGSVEVSNNAHIDESSFTRKSEKEYSFKVVPNGNDVGKIEVRVKAEVIADFAGNTNVESAVASVVSDITPPTATLTTATDLTHARNETTIDFTVTLADSQGHLSAESNYLSTASFVPGNYTVDSVTGQGKTYTATIRPTADGPVSVGVKANAFCDLAGNGNSASAVTNFVCDRTAPTIRFNGENTKGRHFEMVVSATDTPETTKDIEYKWSVVGSGQTFGADWTTTETNKEVTLRGTGLNDGAWDWTVQFRDVAGNVATTNGSWAVKTDEAPELELTPTSGTVNGSATEPLVFTLKANGDLKLTEALKPDMVHHVSRDQVFYRQVVAIASDSEAKITLTPVKQDRDFTDVVTLTIPCGAAIGTNEIAAASVSGTVTYKFSGTNKNPEAVRVIRLTGGYQDDPHRTNENFGVITLLAKTFNGAKFAQGLTQDSITGASVKSVAVAADGLSAEITLTADAWTQLVDIDGWKGFNLVFAGGSVESLPSPIPAGSPVTAPVKVWRNLARVADENGAAIKVDGADAPLTHDGDARTAPVEGSSKLAATFPRARVNAVHIRLSAASAKAAYKPTQATVTLKSAGAVLETFVTDLVWDGKRCAPVDLLVTPQDMLVAEAIADEAELSFTGSTKALYLNEFAVFGIPEAVDPLYPEVLSVNPVEGGFVVQTDMGVSNWVKTASDKVLKLESAGVTTGVAIDWAKINWADETRTALKVPVKGSADAGYVGGATLHVAEGFLGNFIGRSNICETISASTLTWNSQTEPKALSFKRYDGAGEAVSFGTDAISWTLVFNQPVLNLSADSFNKHTALGAIQVLGTGSPTNYIVRAQLNCWTNAVTGVKMTLKADAVKGLTGKSNAAAKESETYKLEAVVPVSK